MKRILKSVCFGNWRGYEGTKEEISMMFDKCLLECNWKEISDLNYCKERMDKMKVNENGLYSVEYWSKW